MKRPTPLVDYASSEDEDEPISTEPPAPPPPKKRRLPTLAPTLVLAAPKDNPALHQGRIRSRPHIDGQYAAYVYVPIKLTTTSSLHALLRKAIKHAKTIVPIIHPIGVSIDSDANSQRPDDERELHISLTRPIYLRAHQRKEFELAIRNIAKLHSRFQASFATFSELTNDERTRTFLTAEIGAGHLELKALCDAVTPVLRTYRQTEFYSEPRFHASIAWALLQGPAPSTKAGTAATMPEADEAVDDEVSTSSSRAVTDKVEGDKPLAQEQEPVFQTIPRFPPNLVSVLEAEFGSSMRTRAVGLFDCEYLCVRIGKDVTKWKLSN